MKILSSTLIAAAAIALLSSCGHNVSNESIVHEDGSIKKTISFYHRDPKKGESEKMMGVSEQTGWTKKDLPVDTASDEKAYQVQYTKAFESVDALNEEQGRYTDTTFRITSTFEKKFRWFYTYFYYSDTYHRINRMKLPIDQYVTPEDSAFVERLPAEGKKISLADSVHLALLNEKWFDKYGTAAIGDEYFDIVYDLMKSQNIDERWKDSIALHKDAMFNDLLDGDGKNAGSLIDLLDSLGVPLDYAFARREFAMRSKVIESKLAFISWASEGTYQHVIAMPGKVVSSNADSVIGNRLLYHPPVIKFLIMDHKLHATSRKLNLWAVITTVVILGLTIVLFARRRKE